MIALFSKVAGESGHAGEFPRLEGSHDKVIARRRAKPGGGGGYRQGFALGDGLAKGAGRIVEPLTAQLAKWLGIGLGQDPYFHPHNLAAQNPGDRGQRIMTRETVPSLRWTEPTRDSFDA